MTNAEKQLYEVWLAKARPLLEAGSFGEGLKDVPRLELEPALPLPLSEPLSQATLALVSSAGLSQAGQPVMDGANYEGDYTIRLLDINRDPKELTISHSHFDHTAAEADINVVYPIDRLRELAAKGMIGGLANPAVSFMGYFSNVFRVRDELAPRVVEAVKASAADAALLVPV